MLQPPAHLQQHPFSFAPPAAAAGPFGSALIYHDGMFDQPLFERFERDNIAELHEARGVVEMLQQRIHDLEHINVDLEHRLEEQARERMAAERDCSALETRWKERYTKLEKELELARQLTVKEKMHNDRISENLRRTERELHGILQKKYEIRRGGPKHGSHWRRTSVNETPLSEGWTGDKKTRGPDDSRRDDGEDMLEDIGHGHPSAAPQQVRQSRALASLCDFLGV